jgi:hypothetical protein
MFRAYTGVVNECRWALMAQRTYEERMVVHLKSQRVNCGLPSSASALVCHTTT